MPFNIGKGPILEFRNKLQTGKNITIKNGLLGLTSHQAILGNNNHNLRLVNLTIKNFEVSGITLNAVNSLKFSCSTIGPSNNSIPFTPYFSSFVFIFKLLSTIKEIEKSQELKENINLILEKIKNFYAPYIELIYNSKNTTDIIENLKQNSNDLFINFDLNTHCNMHGIKITGSNPSVHNLHNSINSNQKLNSQNIKLNKIIINELKAKTIEDLLLSFDDKILHIGAGVNLSLKFLTNSLLTPFVLEILQHVQDLITLYPETNKYIKTNITQSAIEIIKKISNDEKISDTDAEKIGFVRNCDIMGHINKGTMGIRLGSTTKCLLNKIKIYNIINTGIIENEIEYYKNKYNIKKIKILDSGTDGISNITGNYSIGIVNSGVNDLCAKNLKITDIESTNSKGIGFFINNECVDAQIESLDITNIKSNKQINDCSTILIDEMAKKINLKDICINK